ncbi:MAG: glycosyltransferase family 4 protein [Planctomycetota bacterium]|nr:glycosyltransferase family 4 protein [Planctomycetota bacterium]
MEPSPPHRPLRLLLAIHRLFPHGGLQRDALRTASECARRGHEVTLVAQSAEMDGPAGVTLHLEPVPGQSNHARAARFGARLAALRDALEPDLVVGFDRLPGLDVHFVGDPCYALRARSRRGPLRHLLPRDRAFTALERSVFGPTGARRILLLHPGQGRPFEGVYGTAPERFRVLPPGVGLDRCPGPDAGALRARVRAEVGARDGEALLLQLGSDFARKGVDRAVRALAAQANGTRAARLMIAGADDPTPIESLATRLGVGDRVRVLGPRDDVPALLQGADLLVHPARSEPGGAVLLEALVAGRPAIATSCCGYATHVQAADAGVVLPEPFAQAALDAALSRLLSEDLAGLGARALTYASAHPELHDMHGVIVDHLEELASR